LSEPSVTAKRSPGTFDELGVSEARALGSGFCEDLPDALETLNGVFGEEVAALCHEALDGVALEGWVVAASERMQVGERKAAPGSAQEGERGDAVGGVEQGAGERGEVEDLLALIEGLDLDRAEWDTAGVSVLVVEQIEGGNDLDEVVADAHQDGDAPWLGDLISGLIPDGFAANGKALVDPVVCDAANLKRVVACLALTELSGGGEFGGSHP
jgi:hypothetical protein